jgi:pimeloyl-ACP methyl ester carboxylesterase
MTDAARTYGSIVRQALDACCPEPVIDDDYCGTQAPVPQRIVGNHPRAGGLRHGHRAADVAAVMAIVQIELHHVHCRSLYDVLATQLKAVWAYRRADAGAKRDQVAAVVHARLDDQLQWFLAETERRDGDPATVREHFALFHQSFEAALRHTPRAKSHGGWKEAAEHMLHVLGAVGYSADNYERAKHHVTEFYHCLHHVSHDSQVGDKRVRTCAGDALRIHYHLVVGREYDPATDKAPLFDNFNIHGTQVAKLPSRQGALFGVRIEDVSIEEEMLQHAKDGGGFDIYESLSSGADPNYKSPHEGDWHATALHFATMAGDSAAVKALLFYKPDITAKDDAGLTPIAYSFLDAIPFHNALFTRGILFAAGASTEDLVWNPSLYPRQSDRIRPGYEDEFLSREQFTDIQESLKNSLGSTLFTLRLSIKDRFELIKNILLHPNNIDVARSSYGPGPGLRLPVEMYTTFIFGRDTLLMDAIGKRNTALVKYLVDYYKHNGIDLTTECRPFKPGFIQSSPIKYAVDRPNVAAFKMLVDAGVSPHISDGLSTQDSRVSTLYQYMKHELQHADVHYKAALQEMIQYADAHSNGGVHSANAAPAAAALARVGAEATQHAKRPNVVENLEERTEPYPSAYESMSHPPDPLAGKALSYHLYRPTEVVEDRGRFYFDHAYIQETRPDGAARTRFRIAYTQMHPRRQAPGLNPLGERTGPVIVLLHGVPTNRRQWYPVQRRLASFARTVSLDMLGMGESSKPRPVSFRPEVVGRPHKHPWHWKYDTQYIDELLNELYPGEKFVFVADDWGAGILAHFAARYSTVRLHHHHHSDTLVEGRLLGAVYVNPIALDGYPISEIQAIGRAAALDDPSFRMAMGDIDSKMVQIFKTMVDDPNNVYNHYTLNDLLFPYVQVDYERNYGDTGRLEDVAESRSLRLRWKALRVLADRAAVLSPAQLLPWHLAKNRAGVRYDRISVPSLVVWGQQDNMMPPAQAWRLKQLHAGPVQIAPADRAGHFVAADRPDRVAQAIVDWLDEYKQRAGDRGRDTYRLADVFLGFQGIGKGDETAVMLDLRRRAAAMNK